MQFDVTVTVRPRKRRRKVAYVLWTFGPVQEQPDSGPLRQRAGTMTQLTTTQQVTGTVVPVDRKGNPAAVEGSTFTSSDPAVIAVEADLADPLKVTVKAVATGAAQVQWKADADLGDEIVEISAVADFVVKASQAVGASFSFGTPTEQ
jgi:hypothetical protein